MQTRSHYFPLPTSPLYRADVHTHLQVSFRLCPWLFKKPIVSHPDDGSSSLSSPTLQTHFGDLLHSSRNPFRDPDSRYIIPLPQIRTHCLLVNKFPVYRPQLLLTTTAIRSQTDDLDVEDLHAALTVLAELEQGEDAKEWTIIYNCGRHSGNSQPHKHLQLFPKPREDEGDILIFPDFESAQTHWQPVKLPSSSSVYSAFPLLKCYADPRIPFVHFLAALSPSDPVFSGFASSATYPTPPSLLETYATLLALTASALVAAAGYPRSTGTLTEHPRSELAGDTGNPFTTVLANDGPPYHAGSSPPSYNVVLTRRWLLLVPRRAACGRGTGTLGQGPQVNAAGMTGLVWVSNEREVEEWMRRGISTHLGDCGLRWEEVNGMGLEWGS